MNNSLFRNWGITRNNRINKRKTNIISTRVIIYYKLRVASKQLYL